jgi:hypothetical protein
MVSSTRRSSIKIEEEEEEEKKKKKKKKKKTDNRGLNPCLEQDPSSRFGLAHRMRVVAIISYC